MLWVSSPRTPSFPQLCSLAGHLGGKGLRAEGWSRQQRGQGCLAIIPLRAQGVENKVRTPCGKSFHSDLRGPRPWPQLLVSYWAPPAGSPFPLRLLTVLGLSQVSLSRPALSSQPQVLLVSCHPTIHSGVCPLSYCLAFPKVGVSFFPLFLDTPFYVFTSVGTAASSAPHPLPRASTPLTLMDNFGVLSSGLVQAKFLILLAFFSLWVM